MKRPTFLPLLTSYQSDMGFIGIVRQICRVGLRYLLFCLGGIFFVFIVHMRPWLRLSLILIFVVPILLLLWASAQGLGILYATDELLSKFGPQRLAARAARRLDKRGRNSDEIVQVADPTNVQLSGHAVLGDVWDRSNQLNKSAKLERKFTDDAQSKDENGTNGDKAKKQGTSN